MQSEATMSGSDETVGEGFLYGKFGEEMMQKRVCCRFIAPMIPACLLSVAMLISGVHYNVAQAKSRTASAVVCGKELKKQCSGVEVKANNMLECLQTSQVSARCAALAHHVVRSCDRDAAQLCQGVVAGRGNILGCLTTAKGAVSARCNAALNAAFLRQGIRARLAPTDDSKQLN
jgi:hypothetical protein